MVFNLPPISKKKFLEKFCKIRNIWYLCYMKTLLVLVIVCCASEQEGQYVYEAKNLNTNEVGTLHTQSKYEIGDTLRIPVTK